MTDEELHKDLQRCERCGAIGQDRRTLWMACLFEMREMGVPLTPVAVHGQRLAFSHDDPHLGFPRCKEPKRDADQRLFPFYTMLVCKGCRAEWMGAIQAWFRGPPTDSVKWNNDAKDDPLDTLTKVLADLERARVELLSLEQRADDLVRRTRRAVDDLGPR